MIEEKQIPSEYVSIRHTWLKGIEDCRKAIAQMAIVEAGSDKKSIDVAGARTIVYSVDALSLCLVNYGEALIEWDVEQWKEKHFYPKHKEIWKDFEDNDDSVTRKWYKTAKLSKELYRQIIQVLNKYNMLFESSPRGFSNVIMEEVKNQ